MSERTIRVDHAEAAGTPAIRYDAGRLGKAERTPTGGVRVPASLARTGVLTYLNPDGTTRREWRPDSEVFHLDALRSYEDAAVTVAHPRSGKVTPATFRADAVGHVRGGARRDGELVAGELVVSDAAAIARVDAGELEEISAGYDVLYDATPGVTPSGERYDGVQRNIRVNHVALLPRGAGRSGREVALRLDASAAIEIESSPAPIAPEQVRNDSMKTQRIDGIDYEVGSAAWAQAVAARDQRGDAKLAELEKRAKDAEALVVTEKARADAAERKIVQLEAELTPARLDARVAERTALIAKVQPVLGTETKLDGKTELEIMQLALAKLVPDFKADAVPEEQRELHVRANFNAEMRHASKRSPLDDARADALPIVTQRTDTLGPMSSFGEPSVVDIMRQMELEQRKS